MRPPLICFYIPLFLILNCYSTTAQPPTANLSTTWAPTAQPPYDYRVEAPTAPIYYRVDAPTANLSTTWTNTESIPTSVILEDGTRFRSILIRGTEETQFACGFYCNGACTSYIFSVFIVQTDRWSEAEDAAPTVESAQVVWSANRDYPVSDGAVLNFTATGELVLQDVDGSTVWSSNTTGKSVAGLNLTDDGNLVLFDNNRFVVWQSFDYPTDCLLPGQRLLQGQQLIPSVSSTNWTAQKGLFSLQVRDDGLFAYVGSNPPQEYYSFQILGNNTNKGRRYVRFLNGSLSLFIHSVEPNPDGMIPIPRASSAQYMKLKPDGHLKVFEWQETWSMVADLLNQPLEECDYPMACGRNGLCTGNQQCSCPVSSSPMIEYFRAVDNQQPDQGCTEITPLTCNATQDQTFIALENVTYFIVIPDMEMVDVEACKEACVNNCSCKAALFNYGSNASAGKCYLHSELFTIRVDPTMSNYNASAFIKVQNVKSQSTLGVILTSTIGSVVFLLAVISFLVYIIRKRRWDSQMEEESIGEVPGMPTRFSYDELKTATGMFNKKLGQGGFGAVFEGTLEDGSKIAVKCLEGLGQVNKSFIAEVQSIGSIHHVNLVRLRGFCAWKSQRFLVYEFMSNGSLDRWIYHGDREHVLDWECRKKIILDVAKGLAYLHEDCRQKIIHLDIKPQNILLDSDFNAKVSDFGLSKLIDRNQTQVMTTMRGTPGYLAPEWLSSVITEKVDVYSFGIVLLEMLCGRKNFDRSQPEEESWHLLRVFETCWEQGMLLDMVDKHSEDMQTHGLEVVEMMKVASWCLQCDFTKRPSMSTVVKVLEGIIEVESSLDSNFTDPRMQNAAVEHEKDMTPLMASVLSGPR